MKFNEYAFGVGTGTATVVPFNFTDRCIMTVQSGTSGCIALAYRSGNSIMLSTIGSLGNTGSVFVNSGGQLAVQCNANYQNMRVMAWYV